jgi:hypothetical protein
MRSEFSQSFNKQVDRFKMVVLYCDCVSFNIGQSRGAKVSKNRGKTSKIQITVDLYLYSPSGPLWPVVG